MFKIIYIIRLCMQQHILNKSRLIAIIQFIRLTLGNKKSKYCLFHNVNIFILTKHNRSSRLSFSKTKSASAPKFNTPFLDSIFNALAGCKVAASKASTTEQPIY
ncbi:hypothetical protein V1477_018498 [Vespula maculifrons]|uniref:Uncharacterized protein n=1 Tax=Vespula maculifrons TaxID=7453 RepID=A0ABD2AVJ3_VESMC